MRTKPLLVSVIIFLLISVMIVIAGTTITTFNETDSEVSIFFNTYGNNATNYIKIPRTATVSSATMNINGSTENGTFQTYDSINYYPEGGAVFSNRTFATYDSTDGLSYFEINGTLLWNQSIGVAQIQDITFDSTGNIIVVGNNNSQGFIGKYDSAGDVVWKTNDSRGTEFWGVDVDSSDDIVIAVKQKRIVKYNSAGTFQWMNVTGCTWIYDVTAGIEDTVVAAGDFDTGGANGSDVCIAKVNSDGSDNCSTTKDMGNGNDDAIYGIYYNSVNDYLVSGETTSANGARVVHHNSDDCSFIGSSALFVVGTITTVDDVVSDSDGFDYVGSHGSDTSPFSVRKYNSSRGLVWADDTPKGDEGRIDVNGTALYVFPSNSNVSLFQSIPSDVAVDIGSDGDNEFRKGGDLGSQESVSDFTTELNAHAPSCTCTGCSIDGNDCKIPMKVFVNTPGRVNTSSLSVTYNSVPGFTVNPADDSNSTSPTNVGDVVNFTATDDDADNDNTMLLICDGNGLTSLACTSVEYCNSTLVAEGQHNCTYTTLQGDNSSTNWVGYTCDATACNTTGVAGTFNTNHAPNASSVTVNTDPFFFNTTLECNYTFNDADSDTETTGGRYFDWYVQNEGAGAYASQGSNTSTLSSGFDADDSVMCCAQVCDEHTFCDSVCRNSSAVTIIHYAPVINNNYTTPTTPLFGNTITITANVTDADSDTIAWTNFTVTSPNTTTAVLNNANGTQSDDLWTSTAFVVNESGNWTVNITSGDVGDNTTTSSMTFLVNDTVTISPASITQSIVQGNSYSVSLNITTDTNETFYFNFTDNLNTVHFNTSYTLASITADNNSNASTFQIDAELNATAATYTANVTIVRNSTTSIPTKTYRIPLSISVSNATASVYILNAATDSWTPSGLNDQGSASKTWTIGNNGTWNATNCNMSLSDASLSTFATWNDSDFTINASNTTQIKLTISNANAARYVGYVLASCVATPEGGTDSLDTTDPDFDVTVSPTNPGSTGSSGGGGTQIEEDEDCSYVFDPETLSLTTLDNVKRVKITNNEDKTKTVSFILMAPEGDLENGRNNLVINSQPDSIGNGKTEEVHLEAVDIESLNETLHARLVMSSDGCIDETVNVTISKGFTPIELLEGLSGTGFITAMSGSFKGVTGWTWFIGVVFLLASLMWWSDWKWYSILLGAPLITVLLFLFIYVGRLDLLKLGGVV